MAVFNNPSERPPASADDRGPAGGRPGMPGLPGRSAVPGAPPPQAGPAAAEATAARPSVLGKTLVFKGELSADEDLVLQGRVEGSIHHTQNLTVGVDGVVIGDIHARSIVVEGTVDGDLRGGTTVLIAATAKVRGNIAAPRVGITEGATFNGSVDMSAAHAVASNPPRAHAGTSGEFPLSDGSVDRILGRG